MKVNARPERFIMERREIITLLGNAKKGMKFIAINPPDLCKSCKLFSICLERLVPGRKYEVIEVRDKQHYCQLSNEKINVVKVIEEPIEIALRKQIAIEGAIIKFSWNECNEFKCKLRELCKPLGLNIGDRIKIIKILEDLSEMAFCGEEIVKAKAIII
ncbi:MAG: UPF0179 family protein [Candidatus Methanomethylicia archaeon]|jgi:uncharacterized protein (UPF0179 family)|nr:UPF0179 family protein [Candidatus Methanomethylicia archaeon]